MKHAFGWLPCATLALTLLQAAAAEELPPNHLRPEEQAAGWRLLFDGKTTQGWRSFGKSTFQARGWVVTNGWLTCIPRGRGGDIVTVEEFDDFELEWEWRISPRGNSGLKYLVVEQRKNGIGHEYQMIDDALVKKPKGMTASFYDVLPPKAHRALRLAPEVNHSRILVAGTHVEHWLNGEKVLEYELGSEKVLAAVAESKFRQVPGFGAKVRGRILLTDHQDEASFRNIKIRPR
jgi:hypothetical protein